MKQRLAVLTLLCPLLLASHAMAQSAAMGNSGMGQDVATRLLQKQMAVLQVDPDKASPACIDALKEMHKTQDIIAELETRSTPGSDLDVARDVLGSDMEGSLQICGVDARNLCANSKPTAALSNACAALSAPDRPHK